MSLPSRLRRATRVRTRWRKLRGKPAPRPPKPPRPADLVLAVAGPEDIVGFLDDPRARQTVRSVEIVVDPWFQIKPGWTGRLGPLDDVRACTSTFTETTAHARVDLTRRVEAVRVVRAMYSLFYPTRPASTGFLSPRIGLRAGASPDLAWSAGGGLRPLAREELREGDHIDFDLIADADGLHRTNRYALELHTIERPGAQPVLINHRSHSPWGRRQPDPTTVSGRARTVGDRFVVETADGTCLIEGPLARPLGQFDLRELRPIGDIDASLVATDVESATRLAELAAHGQPIHDADPGLPLHPDLLRVVTAGWEPSPLLQHMNRGLTQVRAVMDHHTRFGSLGRWPDVSVLLVTRRPDLIDVILPQLTAQTYPNLEIVLACHGFSAPDRPWSDRVGPVVEVEADASFGAALAAASQAASGQLLTKVDDDDLYGVDHVRDVVTAWKYSSAQVVGRKLTLVRDVVRDELVVRRLFHESYRSKVAGGSILISKADLAAIGGWRPQARGIDRGLWTRLHDSGGLHYACSGPGYVYQRHAHDHTWPTEMNTFDDRFFETRVPGLAPAALGVLADEDLPFRRGRTRERTGGPSGWIR